jgi:hypothetical protein
MEELEQWGRGHEEGWRRYRARREKGSNLATIMDTITELVMEPK